MIYLAYIRRKDHQGHDYEIGNLSEVSDENDLFASIVLQFIF